MIQEEIERFREENIGRLFMNAHRDFNKRCSEKLETMGYTGAILTHMAVIAQIDTQGTRIATLAQRLNIQRQSAAEFVQNLEKEGYVERAADPHDKRASVISFTKKGWDFLRDAYTVKQEVEAEYRQIWGDFAFEKIKECLETLLNRKSNP